MKGCLSYVRCVASRHHENFSDIIISGGGIIGQTMACALSKNPLFKKHNILLIESSSNNLYSKNKGYSNRVSAIAPDTISLLEKLGMWKHIKRYQPVNDMKVWGYLSDDYITFEHDIKNPAYIVENDEIVNAAMIENKTAPNVKILYGCKVKEINLTKDINNNKRHQVGLSDGSLFTTDLVIGADGANSFIRNAIKPDYIKWSYKQLGIVATLHLSEDSENVTAWQRFLPDGPVALLPLNSSLSSLVWSVTENKARQLMKLSPEVFVDSLNDALHSKPQRNEVTNSINGLTNSLKEILYLKHNAQPLSPPYVKAIVEDSIACFPLSFGHSSEYFVPGVVLIGDAAHKVHPLAGQGVNIGFRDIQALEEKLSKGLLDGRELGHNIDLKNYETDALRRNVPLIAAIDSLHWLYTSNNYLLKAFGNSCFQLTETFTPVKKIMKLLVT